jgi:hypothetical protein
MRDGPEEGRTVQEWLARCEATGQVARRNYFVLTLDQQHRGCTGV